MIITLMSDTHFGFGSGSERWEDAFLTFDEGIQKGLEGDAILLGGDVFDNRTPTTDTFARVMKILLKAKDSPRKVELKPLDKIPVENGFPVITISGNHERRVRGLINPVEALEMGGFLTHLHCSGVVLEKPGEKVAIQGISSVPEEFFPSVLEEWSPKPVEGAYNIFIIHQNLEGFLYSDKALPKDILPKGFDLYICGDIHETHRSEVHGKPLILPGSTVATQIKKESTDPRVYARIDTSTGSIDFIPFKNQRKIHYKEFDSSEKAMEFVREVAQETQELKPVIKLKSSEPMEEVKAAFGDKVILKTSHEKALPSVTVEEQKISARESGQEILKRNLESLGLDAMVWGEVFELLLEKKQEEALNLLTSKSTEAKGAEPQA